MKFEIKNWITGKVMFTLEGSDWKIAFMAALTAGQEFKEADLSDRDFSWLLIKLGVFINCRFNSGTKFYGTKFDGTKFDGTTFYGTKFYGTKFYGTKFYGTTFDGTTFDGTTFDGTTFYGNCTFENKKITGLRPFFFIGPLGDSERQLMAVSTEKGIHLQTGCFSGSVDDFTAALKKKHGNNEHGKEYAAALELIELHFKLWKSSK